uniref:RTP1_C1 domain-containing protein n=2 Tax=Trichuris muris TaxID=70415 RepID=A0A5S6QRJ9_TRIMR
MAELARLPQEDIVKALNRLINFENVSSGQTLDAVLAGRTFNALEAEPGAFGHCTDKSVRDSFLEAVHSLIDKYLKTQSPDEQIPKDHLRVLLKALEVIVAIGCALSLEPKVSKALFGREKWDLLGNIAYEWEQSETLATERLENTVRILIKLLNLPKLRSAMMWSFGDCILGSLVWLNSVGHGKDASLQCMRQNLLSDSFTPLCVKNLFVLTSRLRNAGLSASDPLVLSTGSLLSNVLLKPDGLLSFIRAFGFLSEDGKMRRMAKLAAVVMHCPQRFKTKPSEYYKNILEQCVAIFRLDKTEETAKLACKVILAELYKSACKVYVHMFGSLIWDSLLGKCRLAIENPDACQSIQDDEPTDVLTLVHCVFTNSCHDLYALLDPFVDFLLSAYVDIRFSNSVCSQQVFEILCSYFEKRSASSVCEIMVKWLRKVANYAGSSAHLRFDVTEKGKLVVRASQQAADQDCVASVNFLLCKVSATSCTNIFFALLPVLCEITVEVENSDAADPSARIVVALSSTIETLLEKFGASILSENRRLLDICRTLLESAMQRDVVTASSVGIVLGILEVAFSCHGAEEAYSFCRIQPTIEKLAATYHSSELRLKASQLLNNIARKVSTSSPLESDPLSSSSQASSCETYEDALRFLGLPGVECIGHGLVLLKRLIASKDAKALQNMSEIMTLATDCLQNDDSYVFLSAIAVLVCAVRCNLSLISEELLGTFVNLVESNQIDASVKIAEAISLIGRSLGDLSPSYIDIVVPRMLTAYLSAEDFYLRASCLVSIGSIMRGGKFKVRRAFCGCICGITPFAMSTGGRRQLKSVYSNHMREDVHRLHAQLCLEQINHAMKTNLRLSVE